MAIPIQPTGKDGQAQNHRVQVIAARQQLREYLALSSPTVAQTLAVVKLLVRAVLYLTRDEK